MHQDTMKTFNIPVRVTPRSTVSEAVVQEVVDEIINHNDILLDSNIVAKKPVKQNRTRKISSVKLKAALFLWF